MADAASIRIIECPCENCGHETDHDVLHEVEDQGRDDKDGTWWIERHNTIRCRGCRGVGLQRVYIFSAWIDYAAGKDGADVTYFPPRLMYRIPGWVEQLDQDMKDLLDEVYDALRHKRYRLVAMGVRTVIDEVMRNEVGDQGSFEEKLEALLAKGIIGPRQKDLLATVVDAGSAASHRGFKPSAALIDAILSVMEIILNQIYISGPMLAALKVQIPPKPPHPPKPGESPAAPASFAPPITPLKTP